MNQIEIALPSPDAISGKVAAARRPSTHRLRPANWTVVRDASAVILAVLISVVVIWNVVAAPVGPDVAKPAAPARVIHVRRAAPVTEGNEVRLGVDTEADAAVAGDPGPELPYTGSWH